MFDPTEDETAMSPNPFRATMTLVIRSGMEVPAARNVRPITCKKGNHEEDIIASSKIRDMKQACSKNHHIFHEDFPPLDRIRSSTTQTPCTLKSLSASHRVNA